MEYSFYKYHGAGNDFIMIDNRDYHFKPSTQLIKLLCTRRFGIGADGLIIVEHENDSFFMRYYNADGRESTMCGNGGRCYVQFLKDLQLFDKKVVFNAIDGKHSGEITDGQIKLKMNDVRNIEVNNTAIFLNTGSPHHIEFVKNLITYPVFNEGIKIRNSKIYSPDGTNVNFVEKIDGTWNLRTFERGVEDETYACGTGTVATAIALHHTKRIDTQDIHIKTLGGLLYVSFEFKDNNYYNIYLTGPAKFVYKGFYPNFEI